jgi:hypothetical protein
MVAIQIVLIITAVLLFAVFTQRSHTVQTQAVKRIAFILFLLLSIYAVLRPGDVNWIAHRLGVGRGADLLLYLTVVGFAFFAVNTFLRFRTLERRFTDLARSVALSNAVAPEAGLELGAGAHSAAARQPGGEAAAVDDAITIALIGGGPAMNQDAAGGALVEMAASVLGLVPQPAPVVPVQGRRAT